MPYGKCLLPWKSLTIKLFLETWHKYWIHFQFMKFISEKFEKSIKKNFINFFSSFDDVLIHKTCYVYRIRQERKLLLLFFLSIPTKNTKTNTTGEFSSRREAQKYFIARGNFFSLQQSFDGFRGEKKKGIFWKIFWHHMSGTREENGEVETCWT